MTPDEALKFPKLKEGNPRLKDLPDFVRDPANFKSIQLTLLNSLATRHSHAEMEKWAECVPCQVQLKEHANLMRKFGFTPESYREWVKVNQMIKDSAERIGAKI